MTIIDAQATIIDARDRFARNARRCRDCTQPGVAIVFPHVDHRRRKPWPEPYWLCAEHSDQQADK